MYNDIKLIFRIFLKSTLAFLIIVFIFFFSVKEVNYQYLPENYGIINDDNNIKKEDISLRKKNFYENKKTIKRTINYKNLLYSIVNQALNNKHSSGINKENLKLLCKGYKKYCEILDIESVFSYKDKLYYTALSIYLFKHLDSVFPNFSEILYYLKIQKEGKGRRGYAGHHSIVLNIKESTTYKEFLEVLTHEIGHVVDLGIIKGDGFFKNKKYTEFGKVSFYDNDLSIKFYSLSWNGEKIKNPYSSSKDFVSGYALTDIFEDFAESFNMYVNHNYVFRQMAKESNILKKKYFFMSKILKGKYLYLDKKFDYKIGYRPWDSTKFSN